MSVLICASNKTNKNLPQWDVSSIQHESTRVAETLVPEITGSNTVLDSNRQHQDETDRENKIAFDFQAPVMRSWLQEHYEAAPESYVLREEVQAHYLRSVNLNLKSVANLHSFCIKLGQAVIAEFGATGQDSKRNYAPRARRGFTHKTIYRGLKRRPEL